MHKEMCDCFTSLPTGIPLPSPAVRPITFAANALKVRYSFSTTPLRIVFISGIPEPEETIGRLRGVEVGWQVSGNTRQNTTMKFQIKNYVIQTISLKSFHRILAEDAKNVTVIGQNVSRVMLFQLLITDQHVFLCHTHQILILL